MSELFDDQVRQITRLANTEQSTLAHDEGVLRSSLATNDRQSLKAVLVDHSRLIDILERVASEWGAIGLKCDCEKSSACSVCEISGLIKEFIFES